MVDTLSRTVSVVPSAPQLARGIEPRLPARFARLAVVLLLPSAPLPATLTWAVNSPLDAPDAQLDGLCETVPGNGVCTLRAAMTEASYLGQWTDTRITVPPMTLELSLGEIAVQTTYPIVVQGAGMTATIVRKWFGATPQRFVLLTTGRLELRDLGITGFDGTAGGAIESSGDLLLDHCLVTGNSSVGHGGAVASGGSSSVLEIVATRFVDNHTSSYYGGAVSTSSPLEVRDSAFESNSSAGSDGGAILATGPVRIVGSTFRGNTAYDGGAISFLGSQATVVNSTFVDNAALVDGGAIAVFSIAPDQTRLALFNATLTGNRADVDLDGSGEGGAIYSNVTAGNESAVSASNSILAGNIGSIEILPWGNHLAWPQECYGLLASNGYNIVEANDEGLCSISGATFSADPGLEPLAWNGGFAATRGLDPGSPACGAGRPQAAGGCADETGLPLVTDQRGAVRPVGGNCDLGSFEWGPLIFADDFELGSAIRWSAAAP